MLSVADVFDTLQQGAYRDAIPYEKCLQMLVENADSGGLDADLVQLFCEILNSTHTPLDLRRI